MSDNTKYLHILGIQNNNPSKNEIEEAYKIAIIAWSVDEIAPQNLKIRCKLQIDKINDAYEHLSNNTLDHKTDTKNFSHNNKYSSNEEYDNFKINIQDVEFNKLKIRYWWRILYLICLFAILYVLSILYPLEKIESQQINQQKKQTIESKAKSTNTPAIVKNETKNNKKIESNLKREINSNDHTKKETNNKIKKDINNNVLQKTPKLKSDFDYVSEYFD